MIHATNDVIVAVFNADVATSSGKETMTGQQRCSSDGEIPVRYREPPCTQLETGIPKISVNYF